MLESINNILSCFRSCISRSIAFGWFVSIVVGFIVWGLYPSSVILPYSLVFIILLTIFFVRASRNGLYFLRNDVKLLLSI